MHLEYAMNIKYTCTDCGAGLEPPIMRCSCCDNPYCEDCMAKREEDPDDWLDTLREWIVNSRSMPLASLTHFAENTIKEDIDTARELDDDEGVGCLESDLESLRSGSMCVDEIYSLAMEGVLCEYERVFKESLLKEQGDTAD